ncbi:cellulose biosynthesis protein BcsQ [Pseudomonas entomophila]|uniref:cellulose biosynthesis protein BcsQ n=1 Tax=Pseudomonas entomophila TaxID=312306 RepID=UPI0023D802A8|nr:cellulose biosynthesis protein BcsQ [Pseudomonas entomophila]MDF0734250.1 cellulose biosynthesis protein BcsQ [Pseudomonas entomophila]
MSASNDIRSLFKQFGGHPEQYQEFRKDDSGRGSVQRWPLFSGPAAVEPQVSMLAPEPEPEPVVAQESVAASKAPEASTSDWSPAGLRNLLAKLAQPETPEPVREEAPQPQARPDLSHLRVITVVSAKGGVGKTTMAANLATALRKAGHPVIAIDLDPQNALYHHFLPADEQPVDAERGVAHQGDDWQVIGMASSDGVYVLPYGQVDEDSRLGFERTLRNDPLWLARQLEALQINEGAVVVIDTPPGPSAYLRQALAVANLALVVSLADAASYTSLPQIEALVETYTAGRKDFVGASYLINQVDYSRQLNKDITQILRGLLGPKMIGVVHRDQSISEALAYNRNVLGYDPNGRGCQDILECAQALTERLATLAVDEQ